MTKYYFRIFQFVVLISLMSSCNQKNNQTIEKSESQLNNQSIIKIINTNDSFLNRWVNYYKENQRDFNIEKFIYLKTKQLNPINSSVFANYEKEFDSIYENFLVYNPNKTKYLDFDSYHWFIDENGELGFSPDQEIDLANLIDKKIQRIDFRGPSQWVEDVFWDNNDTFITLENSYDSIPFIIRYDLKEKQVIIYQYQDTLNFQSQYVKERFKEKGLNYDL